MVVLLLNGNQGNNLIQITILAFFKVTLLSVLVNITHNSFFCGVQKNLLLLLPYHTENLICKRTIHISLSPMENIKNIYLQFFLSNSLPFENTYQSDLVIEKSTNAANLNCDLNL